MKRRTMVNTLLITAMLSAMGCAGNDLVKKDEGLAPAAPRKSAEATKQAPAQSASPASAPASAAGLPADRIVAAGSSAGSQKNQLQNTVPAGVVYFGFDSYVLTTESGNTLQANFNALASRPSIQIAGHCDEQGSSEYNLALGEKRAKAAQNYLVTLGYPAARISTISYGKERPAAAGHDEISWARNRRDELNIVK